MIIRGTKPKTLIVFIVPIEKAMHPSYTESLVQPSSERVTSSPERSRSSSSLDENWCIETLVSEEEESKDDVPSEKQVSDVVAARRQNVFMMMHSLLSVIVVACMVGDRYSWRNAALSIERQLVVKLEHVAMKAPVAYLEEDIDLDDMHHHNLWASATSLEECASDAKDNLKDLQFLIKDTFETCVRHARKAVLKLKKKQARDTAAARKSNVKNTVKIIAKRAQNAALKLGRQVSDTAVFRKSQVKRTFDTFAKHALKLRKQVNDTAAVRKSRVKHAFGTFTNQVSKIRKQVSNTAVARRSEVKDTAETFAKHILDVGIDCAVMIGYGNT